MNAGVIEGFFGKPWAWSARLSGVDFLRERGYQFYVYAPKADPFLRRRWREPLPDATLRHLSELAARGAAIGVSIGVGLTPYEIYLNYNSDARGALRSKVQQINDTGVTMLCILFDDMRGDVDGLPDFQAAVVADICGWSTAQHFVVCPTYYSYDKRLTMEFGPPPKAYLRNLGRVIDPRIDIFWTGEKVISQCYTAEHLIEVAAALNRRPFIWDNSISNDSSLRTNHLYLDPAHGGWELPAHLVAGLAINPMNQSHLTRLALCRLRELLSNEPGTMHRFVDPCARTVATDLEKDGELLQNRGLSAMDHETRHRLLTRYESMHANPYAQDVAAWLRGEYAFDPDCLIA